MKALKIGNLKTKREIKSQQTKEKIFDVVTNIIEKHGYQYLTVKNICEIAEISNGTFFHYFHSKEEMILQYLRDRVGLHCESFRNFFETNLEHEIGNKNPVELVIFFYTQYAKYCVESGIEYMSAYYNVKNKFRGARRDHLKSSNKFIAKYVTYLKDAQDKGFIEPEVDIVDIGEDLGTISKGAIFEWCTADAQFNLEKLIKKLITIHLNGIVTDKYKETYGNLLNALK